MSNTLRADLLRVTAAEPLTLAQMFGAIDSPAIHIVAMVHRMKDAGDLVMVPAPAGSGSGTRNAYIAVVSR